MVRGAVDVLLLLAQAAGWAHPEGTQPGGTLARCMCTALLLRLVWQARGKLGWSLAEK